MLVKRKKRPKPMPEKQVLPEHPRPSAEEVKKFNARFVANQEDARKRLETGQPILWTESPKTTSQQRAEWHEEVKRGEEKLDQILSGAPRRSSQPQRRGGRKSEAIYEKAAYHQRMAQICGRQESPRSLSERLLQDDKSEPECKHHKMAEALRRRKKAAKTSPSNPCGINRI